MIKIIKKFLPTFLIFHFSFFIITAALAIPQYINYQGVLRDSSGNLVTGTKSMFFSLYDTATSGTALWNMSSPEVVVTNGLYTVKLGPLDSTILGGTGSRWLEVSVGGTALSPRLEVLGVAYAIMAISAESASTVSGYSVATSGNSIIPVTSASGKLDSSMIPDAGINVNHASIADYATLTGTATNATTVNNIQATTEAAANKLLALDGDKKLKGVAISAEAASGNALFINGSIGLSGACYGIGTIEGGTNSQTITSSNLTANSIVLVSLGVLSGYEATHEAVYRKQIDKFSVYIDPAPGSSLQFRYIIIN
jgi:hypothetical protein